MALDIHKLDDHEHLFEISSNNYQNLKDIFKEFKHWTGIDIDEYNNTKLSIGDQSTLLKIIESYIEKTDLNINKKKTVDILKFGALLEFFCLKKYNLEVLGD